MKRTCRTRPTRWAPSLIVATVALGTACAAEPGAGAGGTVGGSSSTSSSASSAGSTGGGSISGGPAGDTTAADTTLADTSTGAGASEAGEFGTDSDGGSSSSGSESGIPLGDAVAVQTTLGTFVITLDAAAAPVTVANFLAYVEAGYYDGSDGDAPTIMHRVIPGFMAQGGGLSEALNPKPTMRPIVNEHGNGLTNVRGAVAMARTSDPDSATSQFFINVTDNAFLDNPPGYAVFGMVTEGMDVVDTMVSVETRTSMGYHDVPVQPIVIEATIVQ